MNNTKLVQFIDEAKPGDKWLAYYKQAIDGYRKWFLHEGDE